MYGGTYYGHASYGSQPYSVITIRETYTEVVTIVDGAPTKSISRITSDVITLVESLPKIITRSIFDTVTIMDAVTKQTIKMLAEIITVADGLVKDIVKLISDVITIVDTNINAVLKILILMDSISISDTIEKLFNYIGRFPSYLHAKITKAVGIFGENNKPGIGVSGSITSPTSFSNDKDKPGIGVASSVDKPERV